MADFDQYGHPEDDRYRDERPDPAPKHIWIRKFNLVCCQTCGFVRNDKNRNAICKGPIRVALREDANV